MNLVLNTATSWISLGNRIEQNNLYLKLSKCVKIPQAPMIQPTICLNTLRLRQNGCHFPNDTFKCIFLNENIRIAIKISLKFVPKGPISKIPALVQIMAWRLPGDKPLSEPMMVRLLTHICIIRPQWVIQSMQYELKILKVVEVESIDCGLRYVIHRNMKILS